MARIKETGHQAPVSASNDYTNKGLSLHHRITLDIIPMILNVISYHTYLFTYLVHVGRSQRDIFTPLRSLLADR